MQHAGNEKVTRDNFCLHNYYTAPLDWAAIHPALLSLFKSLSILLETQRAGPKRVSYTILSATPCTHPGDRGKQQDVKVTRTPPV